jgi:phosphoribosylglycinamide formyltransferase 1
VIGVLVSGDGTNLQALLDAELPVVAVASNVPGARALERARTAGVPTAFFPLTEYASREKRDAAMADWLAEARVDLVVLAGYMQLLGAPFLARFPQRVINVHPALLPAFPGIGAVEQAVAHGVKVFGVTIHFVDEGVDTGPIVAQRALELPGAADAATVREALRPLEHDLLCEAIRAIARGAVVVEGGRCKVRPDDAAG